MAVDTKLFIALKKIKEALEYGLDRCQDENGDGETHFNVFSNAINSLDEIINEYNQ